MTLAVAQILEEVRQLSAEEQRELQLAMSDEVEAAWDVELEFRINEIKEGTVQLVSAEESDRRLATIFAKHGVERRETA